MLEFKTTGQRFVEWLMAKIAMGIVFGMLFVPVVVGLAVVYIVIASIVNALWP